VLNSIRKKLIKYFVLTITSTSVFLLTINIIKNGPDPWGEKAGGDVSRIIFYIELISITFGYFISIYKINLKKLHKHDFTLFISMYSISIFLLIGCFAWGDWAGWSMFSSRDSAGAENYIIFLLLFSSGITLGISNYRLCRASPTEPNP